MHLAFTTLVIALAGAVQATPAAAATAVTPTIDLVSVDAKVPVVDLSKDSVTEHPNVTLGTGGADAVGAIYPATLFLCRTSGCGSCTGFSLDGMTHNVCFDGGFSFVSMFISQPSNQGLPYAIYTGPLGCGSFAQVPVVNTCYNALNYIGFDWVLTP